MCIHFKFSTMAPTVGFTNLQNCSWLSPPQGRSCNTPCLTPSTGTRRNFTSTEQSDLLLPLSLQGKDV